MKEQGLQKIQQKAESLIGETMSTEAENAAVNDLYFVMGGLDAINTIATNLNSALIIKLQKIRDTAAYQKAGFTRFDDFMDKFPGSPMSYKRFNYLENIFKSLGSDIFDLTSSAGLSARQQKLLGKGNVEIDGDKVVVHFDGDIVEEFDINNRRQWMESLKALADSHAEKNIKIERLKEKEAKHDEKVRELYDEVDRIKASKIAEAASNPHMIARVELGLSFRKLTEAAFALSSIEKDQFRDAVLEDVAGWSMSLRHAYRSDGTERPADIAISGDSFGDALENFLDGVDLDAVSDNDGDLAAQL